MKELTIEQKAKAYDEALERAMKFLNKELFAENSECAIKHIFPELAESEDERIRKMLIDSFTRADMGGEIYGKGVTYKQVITWLEKQGEQKPQRMISAEAKEAMYDKPACAWSEEDKEMCQETIDWFEKKRFPYALENDNPARESIKWLKSLKNRVIPQSKQEWSEEDEAGLGDAMWAIEQARTIAKDENDMGNLWCAERWLKSLKERCTWKPSYKQTDALKIAADGCADQTVSQILSTLYKDLKKLTK